MSFEHLFNLSFWMWAFGAEGTREWFRTWPKRVRGETHKKTD